MNDGVIESEHRAIKRIKNYEEAFKLLYLIFYLNEILLKFLKLFLILLNGVKIRLNILLLNMRKEINNNYFKKCFKYIIFFIQFYHLNLFKL